MTPGASPWIDVPDDWLDDKYSGHDGYRALQEYCGVKIKPDVVNEYLIGKGIVPNVKIEVGRFAAQEIEGKLGIDATLDLAGVTRSGKRGTDSIEIYRTIDITEKECRFDKLGASSVYLGGFGVEYYRRVVPLLRKLGVEKMKTMPITAPEESPEIYQFVGAYIWSFYGYTNSTMAGTLDRYIDYLKQEKKIALSRDDEANILNFPRMRNLALDVQPNKEPTGMKFLTGLDGSDNPTRSIVWQGSHKNINENIETSIEMRELVDHILAKIK
jgi:hypothetical protein